MTKMNIENLKYPITVIAPDGWVEHFATNVEISLWNNVAIKKYSKIGFHVLCAENHAWSMFKIVKAENIPLSKKMSCIFSLKSPTVKTEIILKKREGSPLEIIREAFFTALSNDSDILTQWNDQETIKKEVDNLSEIKSFVARLKKLKVI